MSANPTKYDVGAAIEAKLPEWSQFYLGRVTKDNHDETYDITFEDGDRKQNVHRLTMRPATASEKQLLAAVDQDAAGAAASANTVGAATAATAATSSLPAATAAGAGRPVPPSTASSDVDLGTSNDTFNSSSADNDMMMMEAPAGDEAAPPSFNDKGDRILGEAPPEKAGRLLGISPRTIKAPAAMSESLQIQQHDDRRSSAQSAHSTSSHESKHGGPAASADAAALAAKSAREAAEAAKQAEAAAQRAAAREAAAAKREAASAAKKARLDELTAAAAGPKRLLHFSDTTRVVVPRLKHATGLQSVTFEAWLRPTRVDGWRCIFSNNSSHGGARWQRRRQQQAQQQAEQQQQQPSLASPVVLEA